MPSNSPSPRVDVGKSVSYRRSAASFAASREPRFTCDLTENGFRPRRPETLSDWLNDLTPQDRRNVERVVEMTASAATFGFLSVLDGVRAIKDGPDKGMLDLRYRRGDVDVGLNDETGEPLHDLHGGLNLK